MLAVFDANMIIWLLDDEVTSPPKDLDGKPVLDAKDRVEHLFRSLSTSKAQIVLPTPALSEAMTKMNPALSGRVTELTRRSAVFRVEPFDAAAAAECARLMALKLTRGSLGEGVEGSRTKAKFDMQIMAIANVIGAKIIYSTDSGLAKLGRQEGRTVVPIWELPSPPTAQSEMFDEA